MRPVGGGAGVSSHDGGACHNANTGPPGNQSSGGVIAAEAGTNTTAELSPYRVVCPTTSSSADPCREGAGGADASSPDGDAGRKADFDPQCHGTTGGKFSEPDQAQGTRDSQPAEGGGSLGRGGGRRDSAATGVPDATAAIGVQAVAAAQPEDQRTV